MVLFGSKVILIVLFEIIKYLGSRGPNQDRWFFSMNCSRAVILSPPERVKYTEKCFPSKFCSK
jgi:hypothetical protein